MSELEKDTGESKIKLLEKFSVQMNEADVPMNEIYNDFLAKRKGAKMLIVFAPLREIFSALTYKLDI